ncbi:MAG: PadR family transcriptional regulator [Bryobacteraceae bacterium]|jgi:DNA-binding PadR family transcriptional regulator
MSKESWSHSESHSWPWAAFAFGRRGRFFESGEIRLAILSLLGEGPKHGYQLMKEMAERSGGLYRASAGSVYPTLQQLEDEEFIEADQQNGKRVYKLTEAGRRELEKDPDGVRRIWERAGRWEDWGQFMGPEAMMMWGPLASVMKASLRAVPRAGAERVRDILDRARHELEQL